MAAAAVRACRSAARRRLRRRRRCAGHHVARCAARRPDASDRRPLVARASWPTPRRARAGHRQPAIPPRPRLHAGERTPGQRADVGYNDGMPPFLPFVRRWFTGPSREPTRPQREGWAAIASGRDTLIVAPTGSGKTLAAFLWALDHLHRLGAGGPPRGPRVRRLRLAAARAQQRHREEPARAAGRHPRRRRRRRPAACPRSGWRCAPATRWPPPRQAMTRRPPHVLITTPESLYILLTSQRFRPALAQAPLRHRRRGPRAAWPASAAPTWRCRSSGCRRWSRRDEPGARPQRIGCSATVRPVEDALAFLTGATARDPVVVDAGLLARPRRAGRRAGGRLPHRDQRHGLGRGAAADRRAGPGPPHDAGLRPEPPRRRAAGPRPQRPHRRRPGGGPPRLALAPGPAGGREPAEGRRAARAGRHLLAGARHRRGRHRSRRPGAVAAQRRRRAAARRPRRPPALAHLARAGSWSPRARS